MAAFTLQWQTRIVMMETRWPAKPKVFTFWPFTEKRFPDPWSSGWGLGFGVQQDCIQIPTLQL